MRPARTILIMQLSNSRDEYRYSLDEIGHNPYELTSYLTVTFL